jgi:hypothetical protein
MVLSDELEEVARYVISRPREKKVSFEELPWGPLSLLRARRILNLPDEPWEHSLPSEEFLQLLEWFDSQYDIELTSNKRLQKDYFATEFTAIALAATAARSQIGGPIGLNIRPGTAATVPQHIRPVTVYASTGAAVEKWASTAPSAGWNPAFFSINLNQTSATKALSTQNNVAMLILGLFEESNSAPQIQEYQLIDNSAAPLGVESLPHAQIASALGWFRLRAPLYIGLNSKAAIDLNFISNTTTIAGLWGAQFVTPKYLTAE